jgi:F-type H+-transporting ATPase subunit epsilon
MAPLHVEILTPEAALFRGPASLVVVRTSLGEMAVLDGHTPLVGDVTAGVVHVESPEGSVFVAVDGGYLNVAPDGENTSATVLVGVAQVAASREAALAALASVVGAE